MPKLYSPAAERNREPILEVLRRVLPARGTVLQIASGSGQHDVYFAAAFPQLRFQPSDVDEEALLSVAAWRAEAKLANLAAPVRLDVLDDPWPVTSADAVLAINMMHIAPWAATESLFRGASRILARDAVLFVYGPFIVEGRPLEPSNETFDRSLRERDPDWGLRVLGEVEEVARRFGFRRDEVVPMPANNLSVVFRRTLQRTWTMGPL